jgi:hypothetical protein
MNIYFDLDDTLVRPRTNQKIVTAERLVSCSVNLGLTINVLTFSDRLRANSIIDKHYPNAFKKVIAKEDFCNVVEDTVSFGGLKIMRFEPIVTGYDPEGILVDDLQPIHDMVRAKVKYLGIDKNRYFWFNPFDPRPQQSFVDLVQSLQKENK